MASRSPTRLIYRNAKDVKDFIKVLSDFVSAIIMNYDQILIARDFNVHICCPSKPLAKLFLDLMDAFDFVHVTEPTQEHGSTLDLVLLHGFIINNLQLCGAVFSDRCPVLFKFALKGPIEQNASVAVSIC